MTWALIWCQFGQQQAARQQEAVNRAQEKGAWWSVQRTQDDLTRQRAPNGQDRRRLVVRIESDGRPRQKAPGGQDGGHQAFFYIINLVRMVEWVATGPGAREAELVA